MIGSEFGGHNAVCLYSGCSVCHVVMLTMWCLCVSQVLKYSEGSKEVLLGYAMDTQ